MPKKALTKTSKKTNAKAKVRRQAVKKVNIFDEIDCSLKQSVKEATAEATAASKKLTQFKTKLVKINAKKKTAKDKRVSAVAQLKKAGTAAANNRLENARLSYQKISQEADALTAEIKVCKETAKQAQESLKKSLALTKAIKKLNADWDKKTVAANKKSKKVKKSKVIKAAANKQTKPRGRSAKSTIKASSVGNHADSKIASSRVEREVA